MKTILQITILLLLLPILCGCPTPIESSSAMPPDLTNPPLIKDPDLFIDVGSDTRLFSVNEYKLGPGEGVTYWFEEVPSALDFSTVSVNINKISGYRLGGFGVFFSQKNISTSDFSALTVLIDTERNYCIGLISEGSFSYIKTWSNHLAINSGDNRNNKITISEISDGKYQLNINEVDIWDFEDQSDPKHNGGGFGYIAVVTPLENFPSIPVSIKYENIP